ncbi:hypothetical protein SPLC1_S060810 [Arthrospira platensis C1]|nr:hypothetical protein SPLC1_S060810 [Arthrospira platensis C1]
MNVKQTKPITEVVIPMTTKTPSDYLPGKLESPLHLDF